MLSATTGAKIVSMSIRVLTGSVQVVGILQGGAVMETSEVEREEPSRDRL